MADCYCFLRAAILKACRRTLASAKERHKAKTSLKVLSILSGIPDLMSAVNALPLKSTVMILQVSRAFARTEGA